MSETVNSPVLINDDSNLATINNTIQVASNVSKIATQAISFTKKTWIDNATSGTPITAADMNRLEQAIVDLNTNIQSLQDSVSQAETDIAALGTVRVYQGSKILSYSDQGAILFTALQLSSLTGVSYSIERYTVLCCNGDSSQYAGYSNIFAVMNNGGVIAQCDKALTGNHRVNWTVIVTQ